MISVHERLSHTGGIRSVDMRIRRRCRLVATGLLLREQVRHSRAARPRRLDLSCPRICRVSMSEAGCCCVAPGRLD
jgi:hypothetical protein